MKMEVSRPELVSPVDSKVDYRIAVYRGLTIKYDSLKIILIAWYDDDDFFFFFFLQKEFADPHALSASYVGYCGGNTRIGVEEAHSAALVQEQQDGQAVISDNAFIPRFPEHESLSEGRSIEVLAFSMSDDSNAVEHADKRSLRAVPGTAFSSSLEPQSQSDSEHDAFINSGNRSYTGSSISTYTKADLVRVIRTKLKKPEGPAKDTYTSSVTGASVSSMDGYVQGKVTAVPFNLNSCDEPAAVMSFSLETQL